MYKLVIGMKIRAFVLLIVLSAVILSGCTDDKTNDIDVNNTAVNNVSDTDMDNTAAGNVADNISMNESEQNDNNTIGGQTAVDVVHEDTSTDALTIIDSGAPRTFTVRLEKYLSSPNTLVVVPEDTVYWTNFNDPIRLFVLISDNDLWENQNLGYRESFSYTFNETGTYNYSILGNPRMSGTIIVK
jgi:plastocyanin